MRILLLISILAAGATVRGQWREDSLRLLADRILNGREAADRFRADSAFTRTLVRALRTPHSFRHPFDSLTTISRVYAPDSSFRILTWQVVRDESVFRRHGAIQLRTADGSLKLFPLIDRGSLISRKADTVTSHDEKLAAMDLLWEGLSADPRLFVSPPWHERAIADRLANPAPGVPLGIAESKAEVKEALDARRTSH